MPGPFNQWKKLVTRRSHARAANSLYLALVDQARQPGFYLHAGVPDTVDGRFDMIALHCFLVMNRLKDRGDKAHKISQVLFDEMFNDMDRGLRELGVGDMGVGKRVRAMAKAYMGRVGAYDAGLSDPDTLPQALHRNLYRGEDVAAADLATMAAYMIREQAALAAQDDADVLAGRIAFGDAPDAADESVDEEAAS